jgi:hypothetical protein
MTRISFEVPESLHQQIKTEALQAKLSVSDFMRNWFESNFSFERDICDYNEKTQKILKESELGINLNHYDSVDELYKKLRI